MLRASEKNKTLNLAHARPPHTSRLAPQTDAHRLALVAGCIQAAAGALPVTMLRKAAAADLPAMWEVRYAVTENTLAPGRISDDEFLEAIERTGVGWVIEVDGRIEAFAVGNGQTGNVWALFVKPEAQGCGHGTALHTAMIDWFRGQGVDRLWLSTGRDTKARHFYDKHGWTCVGPYGPDEVRYERPNPG